MTNKKIVAKEKWHDTLTKEKAILRMFEGRAQFISEIDGSIIEYHDPKEKGYGTGATKELPNYE